MTDPQSESDSPRLTPESSQNDMGLMLQRRALHQIERANEKPPRSPRRIALVSAMVVLTMGLFLVLIDKGVKVTHRIIDIWAPVIFDTQKPKPKSPDMSTTSQNSSSASSEAAYMISVEPAAQQSSSTSQNTKK